MKKTLLSLIFLITILVFGCEKKVEKSNLPSLTKDNVSAERIWERVTREENYLKYASWPDYKDFQLGQSPHGRFHKVYISSDLSSALPISNKIAPYGSIIVKENYTADKKLAAFTVMAKIEGYDPEGKDWFWAKYDKDGNVLVEGKLKKCADCHIGSDNDCLIIWRLDRAID